MNKYTFALAIAAGLLLTTCSNKHEEPVKAPEGMVSLDLSRYGKPFSLFVPDTSSTPLQVTEDPSGALIIRSGKSFAVSIREYPEDLSLKKRDLGDDEVNKLGKFVVEDSTALVWESAITSSEHHFIVNSRVNGSVYSIEDVRDPEAAPFTKDAVMRMYESARNIRPVMREPA